MSWYEGLFELPIAIFVADCIYGDVSIGDPDPRDYSYWLLY